MDERSPVGHDGSVRSQPEFISWVRKRLATRRTTSATPERKVRILIVDDAPSFRRVARELLERRGYMIAGEATCAAAAVDAVERLAPDAILLDVRLPDGDGFEVSARLTRADPPPAVLLVSADDFLSCYARVEACGARGFVPKSQLATAELVRFWPSP